jgi:hypothetical protein
MSERGFLLSLGIVLVRMRSLGVMIVREPYFVVFLRVLLGSS